jgi:phosphoglycolate phosphatase-like HAD superfamily hydrolase
MCLSLARNSMLGPAPVLDFDGTIVRLRVDWEALRNRLEVVRIDDLWRMESANWDVVTAAEVEAALRGPVIEPVISLLSAVSSFAVLTSNSSDAVHAFFTRYPSLQDRLAMISGREDLAGPKTEFTRFRSGMERCLAATSVARAAGAPVFVGDAPYELAFAESLGLRAINVAEIVADRAHERG